MTFLMLKHEKKVCRSKYIFCNVGYNSLKQGCGVGTEILGSGSNSRCLQFELPKCKSLIYFRKVSLSSIAYTIWANWSCFLFIARTICLLSMTAHWSQEWNCAKRVQTKITFQIFSTEDKPIYWNKIPCSS